MLDLKRTVELIRGAIFEPPVTWEKFLPRTFRSLVPFRNDSPRPSGS